MTDLRVHAEARSPEITWHLGTSEYYAFWYRHATLLRRREGGASESGVLATLWRAESALWIQGDDDFEGILGPARGDAFLLRPAEVDRSKFWRVAATGYWSLWSAGEPPPRIVVTHDDARLPALASAVGRRGGWVIWAGPDADDWLVVGETTPRLRAAQG